MFSTLNGFATGQPNSDLNHTHYHFVNKQAVENGTCSQLVFEENENEKNENVLHSLALVIPFFISYFQFEVHTFQLANSRHGSVNRTNPIYLAVCSFRV